MNGKEFGLRIADAILGKTVKGEVAAVLPSREPGKSRSVVLTQGEYMDVHTPLVENVIAIDGLYFFHVHPIVHPEPKRGEIIDRRAFHVKPWVDGQTI